MGLQLVQSQLSFVGRVIEPLLFIKNIPQMKQLLQLERIEVGVVERDSDVAIILQIHDFLANAFVYF